MKLHTCGAEGVDGVQRRDFEGGLFHCGDGGAADGSHPAIGLAVDAGEAEHGLCCFGPVLRGCVGEVIGHGPDAEEWIVCHERDRGGTMLRLLCRGGNAGASQDCCSCEELQRRF